MQLMGLEAVHPKPRLSQPGEGHKVYPYLLTSLTAAQANKTGYRNDLICLLPM